MRLAHKVMKQYRHFTRPPKKLHKLSCDDMAFTIMTVSCLRALSILLLHLTFTHYKIDIRSLSIRYKKDIKDLTYLKELPHKGLSIKFID